MDEIKCPLCNKFFPLLDIEGHASFCGEKVDQYLNQADGNETNLDHISWYSVIVRGLQLWQRQKNGGPVNPLKVSFLGELGVDTGALRKEFLTTIVAGIENRLFEGDSEMGKIPKYSLNDLDKQLFKVAGEIFSVSVAQGGPAPRFMQEWCYNYNFKLMVYMTELSTLLTMIEGASDLSVYTRDIGLWLHHTDHNTDHKNTILRAITLHATTKHTNAATTARRPWS
ncbi:uncharacterized protein LOC124857745 [Girardinichthys multiradiatus]|uniref:uncharacterized protein LOC124857745 n=1 Tax=Girardinichthys multiradiatus TaxID=208333 RepID=UPI001FADD5FA|nr:uncharacterized protein LOC124857745 [Girardinichthys multiradiatus]